MNRHDGGMKLNKMPPTANKGKQPIRADDTSIPSRYYNGNGVYSFGDARRPATSDGIASAPQPAPGRSKFRGSLLIAASDALGFKFGRRRSTMRPPQSPTVFSDVIEISAPRADAEDEERNRLREMAAQSIGLDPNIPLPDSHSQSRHSTTTDEEEDEYVDVGTSLRPLEHLRDPRRSGYPRSDESALSNGGRRSPHGSSLSVSIPILPHNHTKSHQGGRFRAGSLASAHIPSNSMAIAPIPAFPTTVAALTSFRESAGMYPKYYPPSSLRIFALSRNWKNRYLLLSTPATLVTKGRTPAVSYLHLFKSSAPEEAELERLEINEDSVVFVSEEDVGGKKHVIKVGGADVGAMRKEYTHEEGGHIMWLLQITDPSDAQRWITSIKHTILGQRTVRAGIIPPLGLGNNEPRGDMDVMMSIRAQGLATATIPPTSPTASSFKHISGSSPPAGAMYASSVSSHSLRSMGAASAPPKPPGSSASAVSALKGLFSGAGRPRSGSRATSISSDRGAASDKEDDSFASRGSNLLSMLRAGAGTPDTQSVHTIQSARARQGQQAPTHQLPLAGPGALERRIERRALHDQSHAVQPLGAWPADPGPSNMNQKDRATKGLSAGAMSLQPPPRKRWISGISDTALARNQIDMDEVSEAGTKTPRAESARRVSFTAERERKNSTDAGAGGEAVGGGLVGFSFGTPEQRSRAPSLRSVSTLASGEQPSSSSTKRSSRTSARRWSRQGLLPTRSMPPSDPPPAVPHPYASPDHLSVGGSTHNSSRSIVLGLPSFSKRASAGSVNSFSTTYSHPASVASGPAPVPSSVAARRTSMPPPRPAPTSALPPAPAPASPSASGFAGASPSASVPSESPVQEESPSGGRGSFRNSVAHRTFRLSMGAPKPPPSSTLPPRPDDPEYHPASSSPPSSPPAFGHRRTSSGSAYAGAVATQLDSIPASPVPPAKTVSPFPPPVGPLPPTPTAVEFAPTSAPLPTLVIPSPPPPSKRTPSLKQRLRNLSSPQPALAQSLSRPRAQTHTPMQLPAAYPYAPHTHAALAHAHSSPPPTPIGEKITLFQNDPSFLQMYTPVATALPPPAFVNSLASSSPPMPPPDDQLDGMVSLLPPPRRGSKQLLESELPRPNSRAQSQSQSQSLPQHQPQPQPELEPEHGLESDPECELTEVPEPEAAHELGNRLSIVVDLEPAYMSHLSLSQPGSAQSNYSQQHSDTFLDIDWESPRDDAPQDDFPPDKQPSAHASEPHHISLSRPGSVVSLGVVMAM